MTAPLSRRTVLGAGAALTAITMAGAWTRSGASQQGHKHGMYGTPGANGTPMAMGGMGAAYMTITNNGADADRLIKATADVADVVEIHEMRHEGNVMTMAPLADGLPIPAGESTELKPGGFHIMLIGLKNDLNAGESFDLILTFETAGDVTVTVPIHVTKEAAERALAESPEEAVTIGELSITGVWSRQAPALMPEATPSPRAMGGFAGMAAVFMVITNDGSAPDRLTGATTDVADRVELDEIRIGSGGMAMVPLTDGLPIPAGETVAITPGKFHILLIGLTRDLVSGESFDLTLSFEAAGNATIAVPIFSSGADAEIAMVESAVKPVVIGDLSITGVWAGAAAAVSDENA